MVWWESASTETSPVQKGWRNVGLLGKLFGGSKKEAAEPAKPIKVVKVGAGETLKKIAEREYGDPNQWEKIYKANKWKIDDPESIYPGMDLNIP